MYVSFKPFASHYYSVLSKTIDVVDKENFEKSNFRFIRKEKGL
jgi:hypothetical protein